MPDADPFYLDLPVVADVDTWAKIVGCHPQSLRRAIDRGEIAAVKLGRLIRIPRHSVVAWLRSEPVDQHEPEPS